MVQELFCQLSQQHDAPDHRLCAGISFETISTCLQFTLTSLAFCANEQGAITAASNPPAQIPIHNLFHMHLIFIR